MQSLEVLIGEWAVDISHPKFAAGQVAARQRFEWVLGGQFAVQHVTSDNPYFPEAMAILGTDRYHYFDSRGVARTYRMSLTDGVWTLWREDADFWQRFTGTISADGTTITGAWEMSHDDGATWEHDFGLTYRKVGSD